MADPRRRTVLLATAGAVAALLLAAVVVGLTRGAGSMGGAPAAQLPSPVATPIKSGVAEPAAPAFTETSGSELASGLMSGQDGQLRAVLASPPPTIPMDTVTGLAALRSITFDTAALSVTSATDSTVPATVVDKAGRTAHWLVYLHAVSGHWKILATDVVE